MVYVLEADENDGVDGATGETLFLNLGAWPDAFDF